MDPHPQPQNSLVRISVCNKVSEKENQVSSLRIFLSDPDSDGKSTDLGVGGGKNYSYLELGD